ncbi:MAG: NTP transferase domain-containing protein [Victivallaceae bacterium]|nr:NTP transferase domain-containing protein [Victivallaceae bacterium]
MIKDNYYAVVMAGGKGERFWPQSRTSHPKQLLRLIGNLTLIEQTVARLMPLIKPENVIVITNHDYIAPMRSLLTDLPQENIIGEPVGRDTAPCVALAAGIVMARSQDKHAVMMLLPADHVIRDTESMLKVLDDSAKVALEGNIVTIGVNPSFASTGYGYIQCGEQLPQDSETSFFKSLGFKEKPNLATAENFIAEQCYKWNSGMFVWTVDTILKAFKQHAPALAKCASKLQKATKQGKLETVLAQEYPQCERISIDYAVMEKVDNVVVAECAFDWDDVGSWTALRNQIRPRENNNVIRGMFESIDASNCIVVGDANHLITAIDVDDLIIIHTDDATLVCNAKSAQRIKELVHILGEKPETKRFL